MFSANLFRLGERNKLCRITKHQWKLHFLVNHTDKIREHNRFGSPVKKPSKEQLSHMQLH